ncbi:unnamed protein product [Paramecium primaurelia]|uniref:Transmembrane protein n=1 Tax=Paramecium primaurelia TaxID=5886 RepID=A0A8S1QEJ8_PARPR|nr:unnamed protein product [Paramecium primaurelia]
MIQRQYLVKALQLNQNKNIGEHIIIVIKLNIAIMMQVIVRQPGDQSCSEGHVCALCEQCDLYNIRGEGPYSVSSPQNCGNSDLIVDYAITITLISIWTLISTLMSVFGNIRRIEEVILGIRLKAKVLPAILIKLFTKNFQIISTITTFQLQISNGLKLVINSIENPVDSMAYSFDCFLNNLSDILIIYFRIIWSLVNAASILTSFFIIESLAILTKLVNIDLHLFQQLYYTFSYTYSQTWLGVDFFTLIQNNFQLILEIRKCCLQI